MAPRTDPRNAPRATRPVAGLTAAQPHCPSPKDRSTNLVDDPEAQVIGISVALDGFPHLDLS